MAGYIGKFREGTHRRGKLGWPSHWWAQGSGHKEG